MDRLLFDSESERDSKSLADILERLPSVLSVLSYDVLTDFCNVLSCIYFGNHTDKKQQHETLLKRILPMCVGDTDEEKYNEKATCKFPFDPYRLRASKWLIE